MKFSTVSRHSWWLVLAALLVAGCATKSGLPAVAPDFTLERADGGALTLSQSTAQTPVVLVFAALEGG